MSDRGKKAYNTARNQALYHLAEEYQMRFRELLAAYRGEGPDTPAEQAARREVLFRETAPKRRTA